MQVMIQMGRHRLKFSSCGMRAPVTRKTCVQPWERNTERAVRRIRTAAGEYVESQRDMREDAKRWER